MLLERSGEPEARQVSEPLDASDDKASARWLEAIPESRQREAFIWRASAGLLLSITIWAMQYEDSANVGFGAVAAGTVPALIGCLVGWFAYQKDSVRHYATRRLEYSLRRRLAILAIWWLVGTAVVSVIWQAQPQAEPLAKYWWQAWPAILLFIIGFCLYLVRYTTVLSPEANEAMERDDVVRRSVQAARSAAADKRLESPFVRYPAAALMLYGAYYLAAQANVRHGGWIAAAGVVVAATLARELTGALLLAAIVGGIVWAVAGMLTGIPVGAAIIIGALIIASSNKK
ncbi:hypothetical protein R69608_00362 [Paraburkholderia nemoris]|uniref:hypothetical protein n=1 Tax=Paraburkholderia nemoris TaxID=2793076 RepID=UPI001912407B|nr:hypothetical protein [Paraburkholderia nemoris]MBK5146366.1 hypothetical protein [Burkholderia sp. R-69608]CAE6864052.1 hypothetical protein R69608_00362 [Paraburkholderia nemoris]